MEPTAAHTNMTKFNRFTTQTTLVDRGQSQRLQSIAQAFTLPSDAGKLAALTHISVAN
ncbi:MAG TPA: hypothetical protein VF730_07835 [Terracidiphilus sp.]